MTLQRWLTATRSTRILCRVVAVAFVISMGAFALPVGLRSQEPSLFHGRVDFVSVGVTVADKRHRLMTDLDANDFAVYEDGKPQTIRAFSRGAGPGPQLHVGVLLDVSGSQELDLTFTQSAAIRFLRSLPDATDVTFIDFATNVRTAHYSRTDFSDLVEHIWALRSGGYTSLYDAIGVYLDGARGEDGRKVMVLYTDGDDTRSSMSFSALMDLLKGSDATVYAIGAVEHQPEGVRTGQQKIMTQIAEATGGAAFFPEKTRDLDRIYERVVGEIRAQYTIGYISTNATTDGTWRKVEVKITRPEAKHFRVRARKGYYAANDVAAHGAAAGQR